MECKYHKSMGFHTHLLGINRYIMECKSKNNYVLIYDRLELIDTLWNVNLVAITILPLRANPN